MSYMGSSLVTIWHDGYCCLSNIIFYIEVRFGHVNSGYVESSQFMNLMNLIHMPPVHGLTAIANTKS